jgi:16S rRNA processing protein RimM
MIFREDLVKIGKLLKPHGIKGEITVLFDNEFYAEIVTPYYILELDSIFVPFFIEDVSYKTEVSVRLKFENIENEITAARYYNIPVFIERDKIKSSDFIENDWNIFVGYSIIDQRNSIIGEIDSVNNSTINVLFVAKKGDDEYLIPATADFITEIDDEKRLIRMNLPEGLIDI